MENSRKAQFPSFAFRGILSGIMKSHAVLLCPPGIPWFSDPGPPKADGPPPDTASGQ